MVITEGLYAALLHGLTPAPPELGGLLGGRGGVLERMALDTGADLRKDRNVYCPDIRALNRILRMWAADGITFYGIFHTHPGAPGYERLSGADTAYIQRIMRSTAAELLYFPIVMAGKKLVPYAERQQNGQISIEKTVLTIV